MKSALLKAPYKIKMVDSDIPQAGKNCVLIEVMACAVCGGDLDSARHGSEYVHFGHEIAGVVREVGEGVDSVKAGDKVAIETTRLCGRCAPCRNGHPELCKSRQWFTDSGLGGFSEYITSHEKNLVIYDGLSFEEAAMIEPLGVAMDLIQTAEIGINDSVLIVGLGAIGLMALQLAKYRTAGAICGVTSLSSIGKIEAAKKFGIDDICYYDKQYAGDDTFPVEKFDRILITSPPSTIPQYIELAAFGGKIAYLGFGGDAKISFDANEFHVKKLSLKASFAAPALYFPMCIDIAKRGRVDLKSMISHRFTLEETADVMDKIGQDSTQLIKAVMVRNE